MVLINQKGITFLETLIVLSIFSIMSLLLIPKLNIIERYALKSQAQMFVSDLKYTQRLAMNENCDYYLKVIKTDKFYFIRKGGTITGNKKIVYMPKNISFSQSSTSDIKYTSKGTAGKYGTGSGGTINLVSKNYKIKITVSPVTGKIRIYDIEKNKN